MPSITGDRFAAVMLITNGVCYYCGSRIWPVTWIDRQHSIDHIIPRTRDGSDDLQNLVPCCRSCNSIKGGRTPDEARHAFALRAAGMPHFSREQLAWVRANGGSLNRYDDFRFWFETHKIRHIWEWSEGDLLREINKKRRALAAL
jgi:hypothetical protein